MDMCYPGRGSRGGSDAWAPPGPGPAPHHGSPRGFLHSWVQLKLSGQFLGKAELVFAPLLFSTTPQAVARVQS